MQKMQHNSHGLFIVVDNDGQIEGTITDGDCRRTILKGDGRLDVTAGQIMNTQFIAINETFSMEQILSLMKTNSVDQIPIVDSQNRFRELVSIRQLLRETEILPNPVLILAGGKGTRLRPHTASTPKPMLKVAGKPMVERLIGRLVSQGFREIYLSIGYLGHIIKDHFEDGSRFNCNIHYLEEEIELGTAGPLKLLPETKHPIVMTNGDLVTSLSFKELLRQHLKRKDDITVAVNQYSVEIPFGVMEISDNFKVLGVEEKPTRRYLVNAGVYVIAPEMKSLLPYQEYYLATDLVQRAIAEDYRVGAFPIHEFWTDVGRPEEFRAVQSLVY